MTTKYDFNWSEQQKKDFLTAIGAEYSLSDRNGLESHSGKEYYQLAEFLSSLEPLNQGFIEIGSAWGGSFHLLSSIISGLKISVDITTDMNDGVSPWPPSLTKEKIHERNTKWTQHFSDVYSVVAHSYHPKCIKSVASILAGQRVDLLYIDAEHTYFAAKSDFLNYSQFVKSRGYVAFHDIQLADSYGMNILWNQLKSSYKFHEFVTCNESIGIIQLP